MMQQHRQKPPMRSEKVRQTQTSRDHLTDGLLLDVEAKPKLAKQLHKRGRLNINRSVCTGMQTQHMTCCGPQRCMAAAPKEKPCAKVAARSKKREPRQIEMP